STVSGTPAVLLDGGVGGHLFSYPYPAPAATLQPAGARTGVAKTAARHWRTGDAPCRQSSCLAGILRVFWASPSAKDRPAIPVVVLDPHGRDLPHARTDLVFRDPFAISRLPNGHCLFCLR